MSNNAPDYEDNEEWRDISDFPNYKVSNLGRILNIKRNRILNLSPNNHGYIQVFLYKNGKGYAKSVHRLVATEFIENIDNKPEIDHINTIKTDNRVENLRWVTRKENQNNPYTLEKVRKIIKPVVSEKTRELQRINWLKRKDLKTIYEKISKRVICLDTGEIFSSASACARTFGVDHSCISEVCRGERNTYKGLRYSYIGDE